MTVWNLVGTPSQNALVQQAIDRCDMDFDKLLPSLQREGKTSIRCEWADLSRYAASVGPPLTYLGFDVNAEECEKALGESFESHVPSRNQIVYHSHGREVVAEVGDVLSVSGHDHVHDGDAVAHPIEREVDGRQRVLGLFYLPPYTKVVLDVTLERDPMLAQEVFLAEGAHAVDYHFMTPEHRRLFTNSVHTQQLPPGANTADGAAFELDGHRCSWFDVNTYAWWVGEAFMEGFIEATSDVPVTINLAHPVGPEDRAVIRAFLGIDDTPTPEPEPEPEPTGRVYAGKSKKYHDSHKGISPTRWFGSAADAEAEGFKACKVCDPA